MHSRVARVMLVALLIAVGIGAGLQLTFLLKQSRQLTDDRSRLLTQIARFDALLAHLAAAQAAYVAPGQSDQPWFERASTLTDRLATELATVRRGLTAAESTAAAQEFAAALSQVMAADASAREFLLQEQELLAADMIFGEGLSAINSARGLSSTMGRNEVAAFDARHTAIEQRALLVVGGASVVWLVGILLLMPRARIPEETSSGLSEITRVAPEPIEASTGPTIDLSSAADLCTALSRVVSSAALPDMLARAAGLIDATGVIVWMGSRDELFAVLSHGYDPKFIRRLGSIPREADNATAEAWRTGELRIAAGDLVSNGAIVAPMFGPDDCVGVLAAEVRHGREQDPATQALTLMIAAQLSMVVGAWPATPARAAEA